MKTNKTIQEITKDLVAYFGNGNIEGYDDQQQEIMAQSQRDWENLPCDAEGANADQEKQQADFLKKVANEILGADEKITRLVGVIYYNESNIYNPETSDSEFVRGTQDEYSYAMNLDKAEKRLLEVQVKYPHAYMITLDKDPIN